MKTFTKLATGTIKAKVGEKTTVINTGDVTIYIIDERARLALEKLSAADQQEIMSAYYGLQPRQHQDLAAGSYFVDLRFDNLNSKAVLLTSASSKPKASKPEGTVPAS